MGILYGKAYVVGAKAKGPKAMGIKMNFVVTL